MSEATTRQYVDNAQFFAAMQERIRLVKEADEQGLPRPKISDYIGECIFKIATNFAHLRSFNGYQFKEDMILDGVENCLKVIDNFDETKTQNPFSYFTQIVYFAFLRRIAKEKKQVYIRSKLLSSNALDLTELQEHDEQGDFTNHYIEYMKAHNNFDGSMFEKPKQEKERVSRYKGATLSDMLDEYPEVELPISEDIMELLSMDNIDQEITDTH